VTQKCSEKPSIILGEFDNRKAEPVEFEATGADTANKPCLAITR
jgi:hypothetical protein